MRLLRNLIRVWEQVALQVLGPRVKVAHQGSVVRGLSKLGRRDPCLDMRQQRHLFDGPALGEGDAAVNDVPAHNGIEDLRGGLRAAKAILPGLEPTGYPSLHNHQAKDPGVPHQSMFMQRASNLGNGRTRDHDHGLRWNARWQGCALLLVLPGVDSDRSQERGDQEEAPRQDQARPQPAALPLRWSFCSQGSSAESGWLPPCR